MSLFNYGEFKSHSGLTLNWKIDCDFLTDEDIECLARRVRDIWRYGPVYGIPTGGMRFAKALSKYGTVAGCPLIVDDVLTTSKSMEETKEKIGNYPLGIVIFARGRYDSWINPIFEVNI